MPAALRASVEAQLRGAMAAMAAAPTARVPTAAAPTAMVPTAAAPTAGKGGRGPPRTIGGMGTAPRVRARSAAGWWAAAACLVLAVLGWVRSPLVQERGAAATPALQREALLASPGAEQIQLETTAEPAAAGAKVDVVWDPRSQRGFARFVGLKPNDPSQHQYQLWIFDGDRDPRYPVDGGVFNVPPNADQVVVPIRAPLEVHAAKAFAVTIEQPGGVVVSGREHVVAIGKAS